MKSGSEHHRNTFCEVIKQIVNFEVVADIIQTKLAYAATRRRCDIHPRNARADPNNHIAPGIGTGENGTKFTSEPDTRTTDSAALMPLAMTWPVRVAPELLYLPLTRYVPNSCELPVWVRLSASRSVAILKITVVGVNPPLKSIDASPLRDIWSRTLMKKYSLALPERVKLFPPERTISLIFMTLYCVVLEIVALLIVPNV